MAACCSVCFRLFVLFERRFGESFASKTDRQTNGQTDLKMTSRDRARMQQCSRSGGGGAIKLLAVLLALFVLVDTLLLLPICLQAEAGEKGRDIIIYNGKVILKGGKKKGNIIISNGQGHYKYKKKYADYGGYWRRK